MEVKKCYNCKSEKSLKEFSKNKNRPDGLNSQCKTCHSIYRKLKYKENKNKEKEQTRKYRSNNYVDTSCAYCGSCIKRYRTNVKEGKNNFCNTSCGNYFHERGFDTMKVYLSSIKKRARVTKLEFNIDKEYLNHLFYDIQNEKCGVTNIPIFLIRKINKDTLKNTASLDRIDNSKGYIKGNVRFVCLGINYLKNRRSDEEVFDLLNSILIYYKSTDKVI